jgi:predicted nucleic acid-binding protein
MAPTAIIDSNVLFGWRSERDQYHDRATDIISAISDESLPRAIVPTQILQEVCKHVQNSSTWAESTKTLTWVIVFIVAVYRCDRPKPGGRYRNDLQ